MHWRLNRIQYPIYNLGPGTRIGIWVQGCSLRCKDCISKSLWNEDGGKNVDIVDLVNQIIYAQSHFDGITITGGEPFEQYQALIAFSSFIKKKTELDIFVYSGYTLKELSEKHSDQLFLKYLDYLLDGRYKLDKHENRNVRGSSNQKLYRFLNGKPILQDKFSTYARWSLAINKEKEVFMTGIPRENELEIIVTQFKKMGIKLRFK
jgi:anaerobic ribonucleoside-triphosphate reductase activating protein